MSRRPPGGRGDRAGVAARRRFDGWAEQLRPELWWQALADAGIDVEQTLHLPCPADAPCPGITSRFGKAADIWSGSIVGGGRRKLLLKSIADVI